MATRSKRRAKSGGLGRVAKAASNQGKGKIQWVKWDDGDVRVLRVLDVGEDFKDAYVHRVKFTGKDGEDKYIDVPCLDQDDKGVPCPGCKKELDRRYKFWTNVIVRGDEEADDSEEREDRVMVWSSGITIAKVLDKMAARHSLDMRDIEVEREGKKMKDTKYDIEWADEEDVPLTDEDRELAKKRYDVARYTQAPEYDDFFTAPWDRDDNDDDDEDVAEKSQRRGSAFKRRAKQDEQDEGSERKTASRRKSSTSKPPTLKGFGKTGSGSSSGNKNVTVRRRRAR
jgi:hypothetical protein